MQLGSYLIWSEDPFKLAQWYEEKLGHMEFATFQDPEGNILQIMRNL